MTNRTAANVAAEIFPSMSNERRLQCQTDLMGRRKIAEKIIQAHTDDVTAEFESRLAVAESDLAADLNLIEEIQAALLVYDEKSEIHVCPICKHYVGENGRMHEPPCPIGQILSTDHPGNRILERLEAAEELFQFCDKKLGPWISAAISDDVSCKEFKATCEEFFDALTACEKVKESNE